MFGRKALMLQAVSRRVAIHPIKSIHRISTPVAMTCRRLFSASVSASSGSVRYRRLLQLASVPDDAGSVAAAATTAPVTATAAPSSASALRTAASLRVVDLCPGLDAVKRAALRAVLTEYETSRAAWDAHPLPYDVVAAICTHIHVICSHLPNSPLEPEAETAGGGAAGVGSGNGLMRHLLDIITEQERLHRSPLRYTPGVFVPYVTALARTGRTHALYSLVNKLRDSATREKRIKIIARNDAGRTTLTHVFPYPHATTFIAARFFWTLATGVPADAQRAWLLYSELLRTFEPPLPTAATTTADNTGASVRASTLRAVSKPAFGQTALALDRYVFQSAAAALASRVKRQYSEPDRGILFPTANAASTAGAATPIADSTSSAAFSAADLNARATAECNSFVLAGRAGDALRDEPCVQQLLALFFDMRVRTIAYDELNRSNGTNATIAAHPVWSDEAFGQVLEALTRRGLHHLTLELWRRHVPAPAYQFSASPLTFAAAIRAIAYRVNEFPLSSPLIPESALAELEHFRLEHVMAAARYEWSRRRPDGASDSQIDPLAIDIVARAVLSNNATSSTAAAAATTRLPTERILKFWASDFGRCVDSVLHKRAASAIDSLILNAHARAYASEIGSDLNHSRMVRALRLLLDRVSRQSGVARSEWSAAAMNGYGLVIAAFCRFGELSSALRLYDEMVGAERLIPGRRALSQIASALASDPESEAASAAAADGSRARKPVSPRIQQIARTIARSAFVKTESAKSAELLEQLMSVCRTEVESDVKPDASSSSSNSGDSRSIVVKSNTKSSLSR